MFISLGQETQVLYCIKVWLYVHPNAVLDDDDDDAVEYCIFQDDNDPVGYNIRIV